MIEYYISSTKYSLQERKTKLNGRVYDVVFRVVTLDGIEKQKKLSGFKTKALANEAYTEFITTRCELVKNNPLKKKEPKKDTPTVGDLIRQYLTTLPNQNKDSSIYDKQNIYRLFILPKYENTKITDLTKEELYRWQDDLWSQKSPRTKTFYSHNYLLKVRTQLAAFLAWVESRYGYPNNITSVKKPKRRTPKSQMQFWTREEFDQFISVVDDPTMHAFFTLLFFTGRRKGEIFSLTPEDIKKEGYITFNKSLCRKTIDGQAWNITSTKADKVQNIPVCDIVVNELKQYKGSSPFLFGGEKPLSENSISRAMAKYCAKAEVKVIRIHDLRHSFVSMLIHLGANLMVVADLIGDTVEQVTKTYGHLYESDKQDIIARIH